MDLMRNAFRPIYYGCTAAHAGLLMQRGLIEWEEGEKPKKQALIKKIASVKADELYLLAFNRWLSNTGNISDARENNPTFAHVAAKIEGRLYTGLDTGGTLETGATTSHTYGMPMLAGSSVKGAVRNYAEHLFAMRDDAGNIITKSVQENGQTVQKMQIEPSKQPILDVLFGASTEEESDDNDRVDNAGYIIWHDAWWIPPVDNDGKLKAGEDSKPFAEDVVTVHHQNYYSGVTAQALGMENPVPNQQMAIQGGFYFTLEGDKKWVAYAKKLLEATITHMGLGAKSASGYGYFCVDGKLKTEIENRIKRLIITIDPNDPFSKIRNEISLLNEDGLITSFSKGKNKFFTANNIDKDDEVQIKQVVKIVLELHGDIVATWADAQKSSNQLKAYKFITKDR